MKKVSREKFEEFKQKHYELWDWLSKHPDKSKDDWFKLDENRGLDIAGNCFACHFDDMCGENNCTYCPICKNGEARGCLDGLYGEYTSAKANYRDIGGKILKKRVVGFAKQIRDLPWSEEYVEEKEMNNENYIVINGKKTELTEEELKRLKAEINKPKRWRAENEGWYWLVGHNGNIVNYKEGFSSNSKFHYDTHNYFKTEREADEYAEILETKRQLMKFADRYNDPIDWGNIKEEKWYLCITSRVKVIPVCCVDKTTGIIYFSSKEIAEQAVKEIGGDRIREYLLYGWCDYC